MLALREKNENVNGCLGGEPTHNFHRLWCFQWDLITSQLLIPWAIVSLQVEAKWKKKNVFNLRCFSLKLTLTLMQFSEWEIYFKWKVYQDFRPFFKFFYQWTGYNRFTKCLNFVKIFANRVCCLSSLYDYCWHRVLQNGQHWLWAGLSKNHNFFEFLFSLALGRIWKRFLKPKTS